MLEYRSGPVAVVVLDCPAPPLSAEKGEPVIHEHAVKADLGHRFSALVDQLTRAP